MGTRSSLYEGGSSSTGGAVGEDDSRSPFSNQTVLSITCLSFSLFVIGEVIGAIAGNSWSLLGDAAAMSVDVISYFTNMVAERIKSGGGRVTPRMQMVLEVYVPLFSVTLLIAVTIYVTIGAVGDIVNPPADDDVDIFMLWLFSSLNAVVDVVSGYMFYAKGRDVFYEGLQATEDLNSPNSNHAMFNDSDADIVPEPTGTASAGDGDGGGASHSDGAKNLNMISAFTHVGGDTMRTLSVFIAAAVATASNIPGYLCDAWAAVFVSVTIVLMVIPLLMEIHNAYNRISKKIDLARITSGSGSGGGGSFPMQI